MKALKYFFLLIAVLFIGGTIFFSLKDGSYSITEKRFMKAPPSVIYNQLSDFKNWNNWNPWSQDPTVFSSLGDITTGIDGNYTFTDEYGNGSMTFTTVKPNEELVMEMNYNTSLADSTSEVTMTLEPKENGTQVIWNISGKDGLKNKVLNFIFGLDLEEEIRPMYKSGLENIEEQVLKDMSAYSISEPSAVDYGGGFILYKSKSASMTNFSSDMNVLMQDLLKYLKDNNLTMYGSPMSIYEKFDYSNNSVIFSAAVPVRDRIIPQQESGVLCTYIEPTKAVKVSLQGKYDHLEEAWTVAQTYLAKQGYIAAVQAPFEVYKTDPALTPNPADLITDIYLPIQ